MAKDDSKHPAISFLRTLWATTPGGLVELRAIANDKIAGPRERRVFVQTPGELVAFAEQYGQRNSQYGVYFGICKRERPDGTKNGIVRVPALWVDVDTVKNGWDTDQVVKRIHELPGVMRPSACVASGGGLHLYWFLKDPYELASPSDRHLDIGAIEKTNVMLREIFAGDAVQNIDRIFRLPGTWNTKRKAAKVEVLWNYGFNRVDFYDLGDAGDEFDKVLGDDGCWIKARKQEAKIKALEPMDQFARVYGDGSRQATKNTREMWASRVRYHAPRGYMGIHEASLLHTAQLYMANKDMPEAAVVKIVVDHIKTIKDRDAPDEQWDMAREAEIVANMYRTWKPKFAEYVKERRREQALERKKKNGSAAGIRGGR